MPPKMTTLPAASLHHAGKKNKGGFAMWVSAGPCVPRVIVPHPPLLTSDTLAQQQGQGLWNQEPRHNHGPGNFPCGEAGGPQPSHIMTQTQHPTAAVTREEPELPAKASPRCIPPSPALQLLMAHRDR